MYLLKYKEATAIGVRAGIKIEIIQWLYEYNLDDFRATFALREYVRSISKGWNN